MKYILCDASIVGHAAGADGDGGQEIVHPQFLSQAQVKTSTPSAEKARQPESHKLIIGDHRKSFQSIGKCYKPYKIARNQQWLMSVGNNLFPKAID